MPRLRKNPPRGGGLGGVPVALQERHDCTRDEQHMLGAIGIGDSAFAAHDRGHLGVALVNNWPSARCALPNTYVDRTIVEDRLHGDVGVAPINTRSGAQSVSGPCPLPRQPFP